MTTDRCHNRKKLNPYWEFGDGGGIREKKKNSFLRDLLIIDSGEHPKFRIRWTLIKKTNSEHQLLIIMLSKMIIYLFIVEII